MPSRAASVSWPDYLLASTIGTLTILAWTALWLWGRSPSGHLMMHGTLFVAGWTLMTIAMMLPTTIPLLWMFRRMAAGRANSVELVSLVIAGYLIVWVVFGLLALAGTRILHRTIPSGPWLSAGLLGLAGLYQFTPFKYACLDKCHSPMQFLIARWRGGRERWQALHIGVDHGLFCVGCCWSLMLLMFLTGAGSLGAMLLLGALMALEKNLPWGRRLSAPLGVLLLLGAVAAGVSGLAAAQ